MSLLFEDELTGPRPPVFWRALQRTVGRTPLWLTCWLVPLVLALILAAPWRGVWADLLAHRYEPGSVMGFMDENFRFDRREELGALRHSTAGIAAALAFLVMLFGVFSGGGWLQVCLDRTRGHSMRRFIWGGARYFWRFSRVWIVTLLTLALFTWSAYGWPWKAAMHLFFGAEDGDLEVLASERSAVVLGWIQDGGYACLVALLFAWGDYTRTRLALQDTRSALWAGLCTWGLLLVHPLRMLRPMLLLFALEVGVVLLLGRLALGVDRELGGHSGPLALIVLVGLGELALVWRGISRGARYHAAAQVSRRLVPPLAQPDPWASRVGGPGGPQYPIDVTDDYGVSG
jgi:hypothetical protein